MRYVHPPSFQGQLICFNLGAFDLFLQQETKKKGQHDCNEKEKTDGWEDSYVLPQGWIIKMLLAGETINIFLQTGISNINICFKKKKKNVVVYRNIHNKFASTTLKYNLN